MDPMEEQIQTLFRALEDHRDGLRQFAMRRLLTFGPRIAPCAIQLLGDKRPEVQECAAIMLTTMGTPIIPQLIAAMKHKDRRVCWGAAWVLATLGPEARKWLPPVKLPPSKVESLPESGAEPQTGVWSDAWLTKVRNKLYAARAEVVHILAAFDAAPGVA
jgi:HEAT repeat protein